MASDEPVARSMRSVATRRGASLALVAATAIVSLSVGIARAAMTRYDAQRLSFEYPAGWAAEPGEDISLEIAVRLTPPSGGKPPLRSLIVLAGTHKVIDADMEGAADRVHAAHVRNRSAWGVRSDGGTPREPVHVAGRRALRYRDRTGSALGAAEQTLTCLLLDGRLACVIAGATPDTREDADRVTDEILSTLVLKKLR